MRTTIALALLVILVAACNPEGRSATLPAGMDEATRAELGLDEEDVIQPDVRYLTPAQASGAAVTDDALRFPREGNDWVEQVTEGDVLWSPRATTWEQTFARRVEAVEAGGDSVTFRTRDAGLEDVFASLSVSVGEGGDSDRPTDGSGDTPRGEESPTTGPTIDQVIEIALALAPDTLGGLPLHSHEVDAGFSGTFSHAYFEYGRDMEDPAAEQLIVRIDDRGPGTTTARAFPSGGTPAATLHDYPVREYAEDGMVRTLIAEQFSVILFGNLGMERLRESLMSLPLHRLRELAADPDAG